MGNQFTFMGKYEEANACFKKAQDIRQKLADANPAVTAYQRRLASTNNFTTLADCDDAIVRLQKLLADDPKNMDTARKLGDLYYARARLRQNLGQVKEAAAERRKALEQWGWLPTRVGDLRISYAHNLALLAKYGSDPNSGVTAAEARTFAGQCVTELAEAVKAGWTAVAYLSDPAFDAIRDREDFQKLLTDLETELGQPANFRLQLALADYYYNLGAIQLYRAKSAEAWASLEKGRDILSKLADANPAVTHLWRNFAGSYNTIGRTFAGQGRFAEAFAALDEGLAIRQKLAAANPTDTQYTNHLGYSYAYRGAARVRAGQPAEAAADLRRVLELWTKLPNLGKGEHAERSRSLALLAGLGGDANSGVSQDEAKAFADQSVVELADAIKAGWIALPQLVDPNFDAIRDREDFQKLVAELEAKLGQSANIRDQIELAVRQIELAHYYNDLGRRHSRQNRSAEALTALDAALTIRQKFEANPQHAYYAQMFDWSYAYRGAARVRAGQPAEAAADLRRVLELWAKPPIPGTPPVHPILGNQEHVERSRSLALLAGLVSDAKSGVTRDEAKAFADQAVAALADALKAGWTDLAELKQPDFDAIREREEFQKLLAELEAKLPKPADPTSSPPDK